MQGIKIKRTNQEHLFLCSQSLVQNAGSFIVPNMISVIIPTYNAEQELAHSFNALIPAVVMGIVKQVIVVDGGSTDATEQISEQAGADFVRSEKGRGTQLQAGVSHASQNWLLFLHADTVLDPGWEREVETFIAKIMSGRRRASAAAFSFELNDFGLMPRVLEKGVAFRSHIMGLPYGDQGLLISRRFYDQLGGYKDIPLMEDVDLIRRIGWRRITILRSSAVTSAKRYKTEGYFRRMGRNLSCLILYYLRVPPRIIMQLYE